MLRVSDVGSRNGTWVNGVRLATRDVTPLEDGAVLRVGRSLFVFREALKGEPTTCLESLRQRVTIGV